MGTLHPRRSHQLLPFLKNLRHRGYAAHLTLPYLASGSGKSLSKTLQSERMSPCTSSKPNNPLALSVYETCQKKPTTRVAQRGNVQKRPYHLHDGPEQRERGAKMKMVSTVIIHRCSLKTNSTPPCFRTFKKNLGELTVVAYSVKKLEEGQAGQAG